MFSISELSLASSSGNVLMSIVWFGISSAACLSSASAARAVMHCLSTALVSSSAAGGSGGNWFQGSSARQTGVESVMSMPSTCGNNVSKFIYFIDTLDRDPVNGETRIYAHPRRIFELNACLAWCCCSMLLTQKAFHLLSNK